MEELVGTKEESAIPDDRSLARESDEDRFPNLGALDPIDVTADRRLGPTEMLSGLLGEGGG